MDSFNIVKGLSISNFSVLKISHFILKKKNKDKKMQKLVISIFQTELPSIFLK
jgi:hypothetical protein